MIPDSRETVPRCARATLKPPIPEKSSMNVNGSNGLVHSSLHSDCRGSIRKGWTTWTRSTRERGDGMGVSNELQEQLPPLEEVQRRGCSSAFALPAQLVRGLLEASPHFAAHVHLLRSLPPTISWLVQYGRKTARFSESLRTTPPFCCQLRFYKDQQRVGKSYLMNLKCCNRGGYQF